MVARAGRTMNARSPGRVALVGAGPGDPGLVTARALELIGRADVILYDRLVSGVLLEGARPDAELIYVGKEGERPSVEQSETEELLVSKAEEGKLVVRLKGGDPFVFGRGGEEAEVLRSAQIEFEIVPGVTAGVAAPAYAGIPVTHRDHASAVAFITGHEDPDKPESTLDWPALARFPGTLVFYMGVRRLPRISEALIAAGRNAAEAVAVIERGTLAAQRTVTATLETIAARASEANVKPPAITVVGPVAGLRDRLAWVEARPLFGVRVAITRARAQASGLAARVRELGGDAVEAPAIRIKPLPGDAPDLVCLTSPNGVHLLFDRLRTAGRDARALSGATVAAIGPGTARALRQHGIEADVVPERSVAESLVEALTGVEVRRALIARAAEARDVLPDALRERGAEVEVLALYETVAEPLSEDELSAARGADYVTFTSSSTVRFFVATAGGTAGLGDGTRIVSIGPVTSATLREHGLEPHVEALRHDVDGVVAALVADAAQRK
jgi:uroporphyrinogen III methyltransferase / synthase